MPTVRTAAPQDEARILEIYKIARETMKATGNPTQWGDTYPPDALIRADIQTGRCHVVCEGDTITGAFALCRGADPCYARIENGAWLSEAPYAALHRVAGDSAYHGVFRAMTAYAQSLGRYLRIDTHADNRIMQHLIVKCGFTRCGIIRLENGDPRIAYEKEGTLVRGKPLPF